MTEELTKEDMWQAYREAVRQKNSMNELTELEEKTARTQFESWWGNNYE